MSERFHQSARDIMLFVSASCSSGVELLIEIADESLDMAAMVVKQGLDFFGMICFPVLPDSRVHDYAFFYQANPL